jgi:hypothetical protein
VVRSAVTSPVVAFFMSLSLVVFLVSRSVQLLTMALSGSKIHSCGAAGDTGLDSVVDRSVVQSAPCVGRLLAY